LLVANYPIGPMRHSAVGYTRGLTRGELTPSLKVKRAVVAERNKELLDSFYV
jgi:hypothetical protein